MLNWWYSLGLATQIFYCIAIPSTLILIVQTILTFVGMGSGADADGDVGDIAADADVADDIPNGDVADDLPDGTEVNPEAVGDGMASLKLFTFRGIVAFLVTFGWMGVALDSSGVLLWITIPVAFVCGAAMMLSLALIFKMAMKLRNDGNLDNRNAVGVSGKVQLTIPPARSGEGKVHIMLQGSYVERNAVTDEKEAIPTGAEIVVVGVSGGTDLVVKRK